jgi:AcrR family transcriptional regulator
VPSTDDQLAVQSLLWRAPQPPGRGPKRSLTPQQIAATTVRIADADGLECVSMQRVAAELGVTKMALYRYVPGKAGLLAIAVEEAVGAAPQGSALPSGWRPGLEAWARLLRSIWQAHPWLPGATLGDRSIGPRELAWTDCPLRVLAPTGLQAAERLDVVLILSGHVRNTTAAGAIGTQPWTVSGAVGSALHQELHDHGDAFPNLLADLAEVQAHEGLPGSSGELGLRLLLDGLQAKIDMLTVSGDRSDSDPHPPRPTPASNR